MLRIELSTMTLNHFKGIKSIEVNFSPTTTNIFGENKTGKTTLFDAFTWLLFGKDSMGRSDSNFDIKTLNEDNTVIPKIDHEVSAAFLVNGKPLTLKRVFREKWEKKRGEVLQSFTGHETICYVDEIPKTITEYNKIISQIINEGIFKLITNPLYFNSLNWKERRTILMEMAGDINNGEILDKIATLSNKNEILAITNILNQGKTIEDLKSKNAYQKKAIVDQLKMIPTRIDEVSRNTPADQDWAETERMITTKKERIANIDSQIADKSSVLKEAYQKIQEQREEISKLRGRQTDLVFNANKAEQDRCNTANLEYHKAESNLQLARTELQQMERHLQMMENDFTLTKQISEIDDKLTKLREEWNKENEKVYEVTQYEVISGCLKCPIYKHDCSDAGAVDKFNQNNAESARLHEENQASNQKKFAADKISKLEKINNDGLSLTKRLEALRNEESNHSDEIKEYHGLVISKREVVNILERNLDAITRQTPGNIIAESIPEWVELSKQIESLSTQITEPEQPDNSTLTQEKKALETEIDQLRNALANKSIIESNNKRIEQLKEEESKLAQEVAEFEGIEYAIMEFTKAKMEEVDRRVNSLFEYVKFKMFETQINGAEVECCDTLVNGVPFQSVNTAGRINAGVDIINAICNKNNISAPIFIDNRESVNDLIHSSSQIINLIVSRDMKLIVK